MGEWQVRWRARKFWKERGLKGTVAKMSITRVRETGEEDLEGVLLCADVYSRDFHMGLKSH